MSIWGAIIGMALVTLFTRVAPLAANRLVLPDWLERWLGLVPVAVFTALAVRPLIVTSEVMPQLMLGTPLIAGLVGAVAAWRSGSVIVTIAAGMAAYWLLRWVGW